MQALATVEAATPLADLAEQINEHHRARVAAVRSSLEHARRVGVLLQEAKAHVHHGAWLPWVRAHCEFSIRTAQDYLRLAEDWDEKYAADRVFDDLSISGALKVLAAKRYDADVRRPSDGEFPQVTEHLRTDYCCPRCHFEWSGSPKPTQEERA